MKLSVIITHYNKMPLAEYLLRYFIRHYRNDIEVICIDDGSDNFVLPSDITNSHIHFIYNQTNLGIGAVRQMGFNVACGEYIVYIDADDLITEDYLDTIISYLQGDDVYCFKSITYPYGEVLPYDEVMVWNKVYRKEFLVEHGLVFEPISVGEDMIFTPALYTKNPRICYIDKILYIYNLLFDSTSHKGCMPT
jgi:glycosyltransferase involved in cell wall biosynthesis